MIGNWIKTSSVVLAILVALTFAYVPSAFAEKECIADEYVIYAASRGGIERAKDALQDQTSDTLESVDETASAVLIENVSRTQLRRQSDRLTRTVSERNVNNICRNAKRARRLAVSKARQSGVHPRVRDLSAPECECNGKYTVAATTPNDKHFDLLKGMHNGKNDVDIDAPEAWDQTVGNRNTVVAVIDTGVDYNHPDLIQNMWVNPGEIAGNGVDDDGNGVIDDVHGFNAITGSGDPMDDQGHGTHCAGTIGAVGNNGLGVVGASWEVSMIAVKFLGKDGGSLYDAVKSIDYVRGLRENQNINVMLTSNSWGGGGFYSTLYNAIRKLKIPFIAAAGNSGQNADVSPMYPAAYDLDNILSVAAVDENGALAGFSNYGAIRVDIGAPGVNIASTYPGNSYKYLSGTSMATPHVAGAMALLHSWNYTLTGADYINAILTTGKPLSSLNGKTSTGKHLNMNAALESIGIEIAPPDQFLPPEGDAPGPTPNPTNTPTPAPTPEPDPFEGGTLYGSTLTYGSNVPVSGARVEAQLTVDEETTTYSMYTGADGKFSFGDLRGPGEYILKVYMPGYVFQAVSGSFSTPDVEQDMVGSQQIYKLEGYVRNEQNLPMKNVLVSGGALGTRVTDSNGYFMFYARYGDEYNLSTSYDEHHFSDRPDRSGTIYGDKVHIIKAQKN